MSDIFDLYKAYAIGGPLGAAAQKGKLKVDYDDSDFERGLKVAGQTWLDFNSRLTKGLSKSIEGIVDLGLGIGAGVVGLFGADEAQRNLEKRIRYNWTEENFKSFDAQNTKSGLRGNKVGEFVGNVTEGIGGMVPAIATGGAGMAVMAASAAGNATEEALNEGASLGSALAYGGFTGGIEAVTEKIGGFTFGGGKSLLGKVTAGTGLGKFLSKGAGKVVGDFISEGAEEVLADTLNPLVKKGTGVDKRSLKEQYSEVVPGLGETFLVGGTVGSVMSGGQSFMRNNANKSRGGARATRADDYLGYISEVSSNLNGENTDSRYERAINDSFLEVERELMQMSEITRKNYLKSIEKTPFKLAFDEGGRYIGAKAESVNSRAITNNLRSVSANLKYKAIKADTEVSEDATRAKELIEDVLKDDGASVVITDELGGNNRATYDTGIVYINNNMVFDDAFTNEAVAIHELAHYSEGTSEYNALIDAIHEAGKIDEIQTYLESKNYSSTEYKGATDKQQNYIERTELAADIVGHLLSTPSALAKLHARNKNVFTKLKAAIEASRDDTTSKEAKKAINKVLKNFEKAVDASQGGVLLSSIRDDEEKENTEREHGVGDDRYSKIKTKNGDDIVWIEDNVLKGNPLPVHQAVANYIAQHIGTMYTIIESGQNVYIGKDLPLEYTQSEYTKRLLKRPGILKAKNRAVANLGEMVEIATNRRWEKDKGSGKKDAKYGVYKYESKFAFPKYDSKGNIAGARAYDATLIIINSSDGKKYLYDLTQIKENTSVSVELSKRALMSAKAGQMVGVSSDSIPQNSENVNSDERNSKVSEENSINLAKLNEITSTNAVENDYSDLQIEAKPPKKAQEQKNTEPPKNEPQEKAEKPKRPLRVSKALTDDEANNIVSYLVEDHFKEITEDTKIAYLPGNVRKDIVNKLTHIAKVENDESYVGKVYDIAELMCNEAIIREQYNVSDRADVDEARRTVDILDSYKGKINLEAIREDIKTVYDTRAPHLTRMWGVKNAQGISTDIVKAELLEHGIRIDSMNEADIFTDMISKYDQAKAVIEDADKSITIKVKDLFKDDADGRDNLVENIADDINTLLSKNIEKEYFKTYSKLISVCQKFNELKKGTYINATKEEDRALTSILNEIKGIRGGLLSINSITNTFEFLSKWYTENNKSIENHFDPEVRNIIDEICNRQNKALDVNELKNILKVFQRVKFLLENFTKVYRNGKYQDVDKIVRKDIDTIVSAKENDNTVAKFYRRFFWKDIADPQFVCELLDGYKKGFATSLLNELREGEIKCAKIRMDLLAKYDEFAKKNRKYIDNLAKRIVNVNGKDVPMEIFISAYLTSKREHAKEGITKNGFEFKDKKGETVTVDGLDLAKAAPKEFTELDKQFISIIEDIFKSCKSYKYDTDMIRLGFSNIIEGYYYPIFRVHATSVDADDLFFKTEAATNAYFNQQTVEGAKQRLKIKSVLSTMSGHVNGIARYSAYGVIVDNFNKMWNYNIVENDNNPKTIKSYLGEYWGNGAEYIEQLVNDVQGKRVKPQIGEKALSRIRGAYATYQLGANPKVWFTQLSSYIAAFNKLSAKSLSKALVTKGISKDVDKYCTLAEIRNYDQQAVMAAGVIDKVGEKAAFFMKPISFADRKIVQKLFTACQVEVADKHGLEIGTEENKVKAGELLTELILETQQNSLTTERSALMRNGNEIWKSFTMFSADAMKLWSRWFGSIGKYHTIRREIYHLKQIGQDVIELQKALSEAKKDVGKSTASVMSVAVFMALIAWAFRHLYNKDDEEENDLVTGAWDVVGNLFGMFPFARDIYSYIADGYEVNNFAYDTFNTVLKSIKTTFTNIDDLIDGKYVSKQTLMKNLKDVVFSAGQVMGFPTRNFYNVTTGLINRFFEGSLGYRINNMFYVSPYASDLGKAIEDEDDVKAGTILSLVSAGDDEYSSDAAQVISNLYGEGYNCLPRTISEKLTVAGVEYELTGKQYRSINQEYGKANTVINDMVGSASFRSLSAESQSKAIKFANDYYFALATEKGLGISYNSDSSYYKKLVYGKLIDVKVLALAVAKVNEIKSTAAEGENVRQKIRNYIESLSLSAEQKYLLFNYFGYTSGVDKERMISYIKSNSKLTAENKEYLLKRYN